MNRTTTTRRLAWTAAVALAGAGAGLVAVTASANPPAPVEIAYTCQFPGGSAQPIQVRVADAFPATTRSGRIAAGTVTVTATIPSTLMPAGTTAVAGTADLAVTAAQGGVNQTADWQGLIAPSTNAAGSDFVLAYAGQAPEAAVTGTGDVTFTAGALTMHLQSQPSTKTMDVTCTPAAQNTALATVHVPAPTQTPTTQAPKPQVKAAPLAAAASGACTPPGPLNTGMLPSWPPAGTTDKGTFPGAGTISCTYAVGYSGVPKLGEALVVNDPHGNPTMESVAVTVQTRIAQGAKGSYVELDSAGQFNLPPSTSTLVSFGFVPTRATVSLIAGPAAVVTIADGTSGTTAPTRTVIHYRQTVRLSNVLVNGVPLDIGGSCQATDADTVLQGVAGAAGDPRSYDIERGGLLTGHISIPAFTGCGSGGHLDSLLTAEVSGTELLELEQAPLCLPASNGCASEPVPALPPLSLMPTS